MGELIFPHLQKARSANVERAFCIDKLTASLMLPHSHAAAKSLKGFARAFFRFTFLPIRLTFFSIAALCLKIEF
ncbi:MAG: hypothetical protein EAZ80_10725 [Runella slithyformis]|nr:MAG: hypothetical protein EAZ80_10725 [Runella slithyformis]